MARQGLRIELSSALRTAKRSGKNETRKKISVKTNVFVQLIDLHVCPQHSPKELAGHFLVVFEDLDNSLLAVKEEGKEQTESLRIAALEQELQITRESHQTTIEELESSNEELKSTNEELQSANEELQSTNEEMESSKEELQSLNEELQTVNNELQSKVEELSAAHDDMNNLLNSTEIATIFLDRKLHIRRFTSESTKIVNLIQTDIGRPLHHVVSNLIYEEMIPDCNQVIENLIPKEHEVQTKEGKWFNMRLIPYRTMDNRIDGLVLTFSPIDDQKKAQAFIRDSQKVTYNIFDMYKEPMVVLDHKGRIVLSNVAFFSMIDIDQDHLNGFNFFDISDNKSMESKLKSMFERAKKESKNFKIDDFRINKKRFILEGQIVNPEKNSLFQILLKFVTYENREFSE
jgi:two-component system CheB/CheR fusion protein